MENKTAEERFCKVYTEFYGEPIDKAEQITEHRFNGNELMEFCEFYASQQLAEKDKEIERLKDEFSKGYLCATAQIVEQYKEDTIAEGVLRCNYLSIERMKKIGVDEHEINILKPIVSEIERKQSLNK